MKRAQIIVWLFFAAIAACILIAEPENAYMPVLALFVACIAATVHLRRYAMIKNGKAIPVGRRPLFGAADIILMALSLAFIVIGILKLGMQKMWLGVSFDVFIGFIFLSFDIMIVRRYLFLLEDRRISMTSRANTSTKWAYDEIQAAGADENKTVFKNNSGQYVEYKTYLDHETRQALKKFLTDKGIEFSERPDDI